MLDQNSRRYLLSSQDLMYSMLTFKANSLYNLKSYNAEKFLGLQIQNLLCMDTTL